MPEATVLYEVSRVLQFVNGSAVSIPLELCSDELTTKEAIARHSAFFEKRKATGAYDAMGEFGVVRVSFTAQPVRGPDSRIVQPMPGLIIPRA